VFRSLKDYLRLAAAYVRLNLNAQLEYRGAFFSEVLSMFLNDCAWIIFWMFFFMRFPILSGWGLNDVMTLWAICAAGFGLAYSVMGNGLYLARLIAQGEIDVWLLHPRAVLPHILLGRMSASAWGDVLFGYGVYLALVCPDVVHFAMFVCLSLSVAVLFVGFSVMTGSLGFFLGNAGAISDQMRSAMVTFATYPAALFDGWIKVILFTAIPAGFVSYAPVEALRTLSLAHAGFALLGSIGILSAGAGLFYLGLRRYESGNLIAMRG
jgi:ABC-2 type transport system permease protein